jgi:threonine/homoserine/homoserine lactone efflux protein
VIAPHLLAVFVVAVVLLMLLPGPNVALITSTAMAHGRAFGFATVAGTASAMVVQLAATGLGMGVLLGAAGAVFGVVRWAGAGYLVYLGVREFLARPAAVVAARGARSAGGCFARGLLVSLTNPKTLFFYAAFFPQFLRPGAGYVGQVTFLAAVFVAIALLVDSGWVCAAHYARGLLTRHAVWRQRVSGTILVGTGGGAGGVAGALTGAERVDEFRAKILEILDVAGRDCQAGGDSGGGDQGIFIEFAGPAMRVLGPEPDDGGVDGQNLEGCEGVVQPGFDLAGFFRIVWTHAFDARLNLADCYDR